MLLMSRLVEIKDREKAISLRGKAGTRYDNSSYWKNYYEEKLSRRDTVRERFYANFLYFLSHRGAKVLDLASGCGFLPLEMSRLGFKVTCLDRYPEMIKMARHYFGRYKVSMRIIKADVVDIPVEDSLLEVVTAMSIVEHLPLEEVKEKLLPEIWRVLEDDGLLLIHVPVRSYITRFKRWWRILRGDLPVWAIDDDGDLTHRFWFGVKDYVGLIEKSGFKVDYVRFNYSRSNEKLFWMKLLELVVSKMDGSFLKWGDGLGFRIWWLSKLAVSSAFVCHKTKLNVV